MYYRLLFAVLALVDLTAIAFAFVLLALVDLTAVVFALVLLALVDLTAVVFALVLLALVVLAPVSRASVPLIFGTWISRIDDCSMTQIATLSLLHVSRKLFQLSNSTNSFCSFNGNAMTGTTFKFL